MTIEHLREILKEKGYYLTNGYLEGNINSPIFRFPSPYSIEIYDSDYTLLDTYEISRISIDLYTQSLRYTKIVDLGV